MDDGIAVLDIEVELVQRFRAGGDEILLDVHRDVGLSIFLRGRAIGKLQVIDARFVREKFRLGAARFLAQGSCRLASAIERRTRGVEVAGSGRESGTARLEEAVAAFREALKENTREHVPLAWATTQNNLGTALWTLGRRVSGTARLEEAVAAFRDALKEQSRESVPLAWARTQNNLGLALWELGGRESGTARLEEAVGAIRPLSSSVHPAIRA
jgi:tetratricopeptide (TPR) repeat protein